MGAQCQIPPPLHRLAALYELDHRIVHDDVWKQMAHFFKRPGLYPVCSDSELKTMTLVGECREWHMKTDPSDGRDQS